MPAGCWDRPSQPKRSYRRTDGSEDWLTKNRAKTIDPPRRIRAIALREPVRRIACSRHCRSQNGLLGGASDGIRLHHLEMPMKIVAATCFGIAAGRRETGNPIARSTHEVVTRATWERQRCVESRSDGWL